MYTYGTIGFCNLFFGLKDGTFSFKMRPPFLRIRGNVSPRLVTVCQARWLCNNR